MAAVVGLSACGERRDPSVEQVRLDVAIERLQSGAVVKSIEKDQKDAEKKNGEKAALPWEELQDKTLDDPCPSLVTEGMLQLVAEPLGDCLREQLMPGVVAMQALQYFKTYRMETASASDRQLSEMSDSEIVDFLDANFIDPHLLIGTAHPAQTRIRANYTNEELGELLQLVARRDYAFMKAELAILKVFALRPKLMDALKSINRYRLFQVLAATQGDPGGFGTAMEMTKVLIETHYIPVRIDRAAPLLHPYALLALIPSPGKELEPLSPGENPFLAAMSMMNELGGGSERTSQIVGMYALFREKDNPKLATHPEPALGAARVAFMDTGFDYVTYPDLAVFAGLGRKGELAQGDYADQDDNSYLPALGGSNHGSGTLATMLTIVAKHAPEVLAERKIDTAMWKVNSIRSLLAGPPFVDSYSFDRKPHAYADALIAQTRSTGVKPDMVSISLGFQIRPILDRIGEPALLKRAPWLWIMAAGNSAIDVQESAPYAASCLADISVQNRPMDRMLCVGALKRGILNDQIASYSNHGALVDVYAYETYLDLCPNGTSCSTPAVTAAAAILKAKFPKLTAAQLKQVIVQSGEDRTLEIADEAPQLKIPGMEDEKTELPAKRKVRVFDPVTMMDRAIQNAQKLLSQKKK